MSAIPDPLSIVARARPAQPFIHTGAGPWTYAEANSAVDDFVDAHRAEGLRLGDRVALVAHHDIATVFRLLALLRDGHAVFLLSPRLPQVMLRDQIARCNPVHTILDPTPTQRSKRVSEGKPPEWDPEAVATLLFTSGSSGPPKIVAHTLDNHIKSAEGVLTRVPLGWGDRWALSLPLYHVGGLGILFRVLLAGAQAILPSSPGAIDEMGEATHLSLVPVQLKRLLHRDTPSLKTVMLGGSTIPSGLLDEAAARSIPVQTSYGLTEMTSTVTLTEPSAGRGEWATSGGVLPFRALRVSDDAEVQVAGPTLCAGFFEGDSITPIQDPDGWYRTGDLGQIDAHGRLTVTGRRDRLFISGGENIQPEVIERALVEIPGVHDAMVVPVRDAVFGFRPVAFVDALPHALPGGAALSDALSRALPRFMVPIAFLPFPAQEHGIKPIRARLIDLAQRKVDRRV